jgi:DNA helicase-2/ATP-dependent DNA helicase PcrA
MPTILLNSAQRAAVEHPGGPVLVLAGAGSGKTRVLTERIARLLSLGTPAERVLAFTFTNRAAREVRERVARSLGEAASRVWLGTFHGTALRILRREARKGEARLEPGFVVYDREDQETLLKKVMADAALQDDSLKPGDVLRRISDAKNALVTPEEAAAVAMTPHQRRVVECYARYQEGLRRQAALDFDDLIVELVWLFRRRPEVATVWARRFHHVLVDEYQDTNHAQFRLDEALARGHGNVIVVGDDDQSIYGFRGADLANVLDFERAFPGAAVLRLEQNYRSTGNILAAANAVIANNQARKGKQLWCERESGAALRFVLAADESDEARRIVRFIEERAHRPGAPSRLSQCAVLYRTHARSRAIETELRHRGIPYEVVGGISFFQRREVKDLLGYLRLTVNPADANAFWRVMNVPKRGLGDAVRARIETRLAAGVPEPLEALRALVQEGELGRAGAAASEFVGLVDALRARVAESPDRLLALVLERTGYLGGNGGEKGEDQEREERRANVEELLTSAALWAASSPEPGLEAYLAEAALLTDVDRLEEDADRVLLLTVHNAKGLEFDAVAIAGLEEGLFPHASALDSPAEAEEERRLFYVALTRARHEVLLTAAAFRHRYLAGLGYSAAGGQVSRFVEEIPEHLLERDQPVLAGHAEDVPGEWRARRDGRRASTRSQEAWAASPIRPRGRAIGREVFHEEFGRGVVIAAEGQGGEARYTVRFGTRIKKILGRFLTEGSHVD